MPDTPSYAEAPFAAVVVAAGKGLRAGQAQPKQFASWRGKPMLRRAVEGMLAAGAGDVVAVIPGDAISQAQDALAGLDRVRLQAGGETRQMSVRNGLEALADEAPHYVLIHDAARPDCPADTVQRLLAAVASSAGAIPVLPLADSVVYADGKLMGARANRDALRRVQTPQAFRFDAILAAHRAWTNDTHAGDDAQVAHAAGFEVALVEGDERLHKVTYASDFKQAIPVPMMRVGTGYDVHRLTPGEELWLCGVRIEHDQGLAGHSDADVALHAVVDAILGACGQGDIGQHFPPSDPQWSGAASARFVEHAAGLADLAGYRIGNVDCTIICEAPRIGPYRDRMRACLADLLGIAVEAVSVKATTTERLGFTGRGEGIAAQAVAMLVSHD